MRRLSLAIAAASTAVLAQGVAAQGADFLTARKLGCALVQIAHCTDNEPPLSCDWDPATEEQKKQVLVLDFLARKITFRTPDKEEAFAVLADDKIDGGERRVGAISIMTGPISIVVERDGLLTIWFQRFRATAQCRIETQ